MSIYLCSDTHCPELVGHVDSATPEDAARVFADNVGLLDDPDTWCHVTVRLASGGPTKLLELRRKVTCTELHKSGEHAT